MWYKVNKWFKRLLSVFSEKKHEVKKTISDEPSEEQLLFAEHVRSIIVPVLESSGFKENRVEIEEYFTTIIYRRGNLYVKINSTTFPTDYPYYYNVELGEGDSEDFFEYDWNSVGIWAIARIVDPEIEMYSYDFPYNQNVEPSIERAKADLIKYGDGFLNGDLSDFYKARSEVNKKRKPYIIHTPDANGKYTSEYESKSEEQKRKYS